MLKNHYGIMVNSEEPITGVFQNNHIEWLGEELYNAIDLDFEEHQKECENEDHDNCYCSDYSTMLIGFEEVNGLFEPDPKAEYSAIVGEIYAQVIQSKWGITCALCSPCYPGQGDVNSPGEFLAYSFPPEILGESFDRTSEVFKL